VPALLDHIREGVQAGDYSGRFAAVALCPVLLLDDLGAEKRASGRTRRSSSCWTTATEMGCGRDGGGDEPGT
jgi:hypothetical protein